MDTADIQKIISNCFENLQSKTVNYSEEMDR